MSDCAWGQEEIHRDYHASEWGVPVHDDRKQFEFLMMEVMQCGLSWMLMLKKRETFRECFDGFDYDEIAAYSEDDIQRIFDTSNMIRSRRKIEAVISNAQKFIEIREEFGSFSEWLWSFTDGKTLVYPSHDENVPAENDLSRKIATELKRRGFKYLGPVTVYSHIQACGLINDHGHECPRFDYINSIADVRVIDEPEIQR